MKLLVFGSNGHIGRHFCSSQDAIELHEFLKPSREVGDLLDVEKLTKYIQLNDFDLALNLAGYLPHKQAKAYGYEVNSLGSANLATAMLRAGKTVPIMHFSSATEILVESIAESQYSTSKIEGFQNLLSVSMDQIPIIQVVLHNIIGRDRKSKSLFNQLLVNSRNNIGTTINFPHRVRDFVWIDDLIIAMLEVLERVEYESKRGSLPPLTRFEIGTGIATSLSELAELVYRMTGCDQQIHLMEMGGGDKFPSIFANVASGECIICPTSIESIIRTTLELGDK